MNNKQKNMKELDFKTAFKYPFNRAMGMLNILWVFLPIVGWLALGGYAIRIVRQFSAGKFKKLPALEFRNDLNLGFFMFLKALPFAIAYIIVSSLLDNLHSPMADLAGLFIALFVIPMLAINFFNKQTVESFFEFGVLTPVFNNFGDYTIVLVKSILLQLLFLVMIIVLVGFPAGAFTKNIFLADFYRRKVK